MCNFFSFVTNPNVNKDFYYFDWQMRQSDKEGADSHSHICAHFKLDEDKCNKYEFNPLTKEFQIDMQNAKKDDSRRAEKWVSKLDWKRIVEPLIVKPIINPFELPKVEQPTDEHIGWLKDWASVRDSVYGYISSFFAIKYQRDFSSIVKLWESGLVPSFDGTIWRLHSGKNADVVYEWQEEQK